MKDKIFIANGQGFWGDSIDAPVHLVQGGQLDYLTLDYLAEVTMSIMQRQKLKKPELGYATDFVQLIERILPTIVEKNIKVIANAGGVNPEACRQALFAVAKKLGIKGLKIGVVYGDNILPRISEMETKQIPMKSMDTGESLY
ncbi:MAG TPA: acyclic terpene utilization AtuA family protein, partial [bacterium]|nr:acyclic terpene utilization AtuA family protein [bacterium]